MEHAPTRIGKRASTQLSYRDAAIVAAALQIGAATLYSEDLQDGQEFDGVKVVNPFLSD